MAFSGAHILGLKLAGPTVPGQVSAGVARKQVFSTADNGTGGAAPFEKEAPAPSSSRFEQAADASYGAALSYVMDIIHAPAVTRTQARDMMQDAIAAWNAHINPGFLQYRKSVADDYAAIEWRDGKPGGVTLIDAMGKEYIDCLGGFGIYNCGHSHPVVLSAVRAQLAKQPLHSQELLDPLRAYAAALLVKTLPGDLRYAFFTNSGTESVECALKMAMLSTGRKHFIGLVGAFHGKSLGSLSGTSKAVFRRPFSGGLLPFTHVPVNDAAALRRAFEAAKFTGADIAGLLIEPILGEGGIHECSDEFLRLGRALCDEAGACLIFDEVQTGMGRTGTMWACQAAGVAPDVIAIGKAFGGGVMGAGATVGTRKVWEKFFDNPFLHTTTFGGNPCSMAAAIAALSVIHNEGLVAAAAAQGAYFKSRLAALAAAYPRVVVDVRGRGLMLGLEFPTDEVGYDFSRGCFGRGVLLSGTLVNSRVVRVEPPLTITKEEIDTVVDRMAAVLAEVAAKHGLAPTPAPARGRSREPSTSSPRDPEDGAGAADYSYASEAASDVGGHTRRHSEADGEGDGESDSDGTATQVAALTEGEGSDSPRSEASSE